MLWCETASNSTSFSARLSPVNWRYSSVKDEIPTLLPVLHAPYNLPCTIFHQKCKNLCTPGIGKCNQSAAWSADPQIIDIFSQYFYVLLI